jgi:hypothetical protein
MGRACQEADPKRLAAKALRALDLKPAADRKAEAASAKIWFGLFVATPFGWGTQSGFTVLTGR